jgi:predicted enzyme related to lactoylglutathione lyase
VLQLHSFEVKHHHGAIGNRDDKPYGNGVLLWFEVDDFEGVVQRSAEMGSRLSYPVIEIPLMVTVGQITGNAGCGTRTAISWW